VKTLTLSQRRCVARCGCIREKVEGEWQRTITCEKHANRD
jgi:hypothetical protein